MGPLAGLKVVEFTGLGPAPFACMYLADLGADVVRIDRAGDDSLLGLSNDVLERGRRSVVLDLKSPTGKAAAVKLIAAADVLVEGFRPGVLERLGLGPVEMHAVNPRLVYARMTGWGQTGPLSQTAGHDLGYIALTGALHAIGPAGQPVPPLNLVGDFGGGSMFLVAGVLAALFERQTSGRGQVVDAAITDGASLLMSMMYSMVGEAKWHDGRETNLLDGGSAVYRTYECADGRHLAVAPLERKFFVDFATRLGIDPADYPDHSSPAAAPALAERLAALFRTRTRDDWCALFEGSDACVAPVLSLEEAPHHPHNTARGTFVDAHGKWQPTPAPRFDRTPPELPAAPPKKGDGAAAALAEWGFSQDEITALGAR